MNTRSNVMPDSSINAQVATPEAFAATRPLYWSVRRELWENRSIYIAPLAVSGVILFASMVSALRLPAKLQAAPGLTAMQQHELLERPYMLAALMIMAVTTIVSIFYCLDALHGERRDRSILFWKSVPVSDLTTVLSKASIPLLVLPLLSVAVTVVTQFAMLLIQSVVLLASGHGVALLWNNVPLSQMSITLSYHLIAIHALYYSPIYCWMLLVSGWARRATFLWATLPVFAVAVLEKIAFNGSHFSTLIVNRFKGGESAGIGVKTGVMMHPLTFEVVGRFLSSPGLWIGLAVAAAFLAAAVRVRRYQGPI